MRIYTCIWPGLADGSLPVLLLFYVFPILATSSLSSLSSSLSLKVSSHLRLFLFCSVFGSEFHMRPNVA